MNTEDVNRMIKQLEASHKHQHSLVEALEAEKAPSSYVMHAKVAKLRIKDEITKLKNEHGIE